MRTYFNIAYRDKERAKKLGALWCAVQKSWYATDADVTAKLSEHFSFKSSKNTKSCFNATELALPKDLPPLLQLKNEDRNFGGNSLFVDLIPLSCWFSNVRSSIAPSDWRRLSFLTRERADFKCEICNAPQNDVKKFYLEAHERWEFTCVNNTPTQILRRIICLCRPCHMATHFGLAQIQGRSERAFAHLMRVNAWTKEQADSHIEEAFGLWRARNQGQWELDLSILEDSGVEIKRKK